VFYLPDTFGAAIVVKYTKTLCSVHFWTRKGSLIPTTVVLVLVLVVTVFEKCLRLC